MPVPVFAVIDGVALLPTGTVVIGKVAVVAPAGTVTELATVADEPLEASVTTIPPVGAGPVRVTVPVDEAPPTTVVGLRVKALTVGALTVKIAVFDPPPLGSVAVRVTDWFVATGVVVIVK